MLGMLLSAIALLFASYGLITKDFKFGDIMIFFLGLTMLVIELARKTTRACPVDVSASLKRAASRLPLSDSFKM